MVSAVRVWNIPAEVEGGDRSGRDEHRRKGQLLKVREKSRNAKGRGNYREGWTRVEKKVVPRGCPCPHRRSSCRW
jgi:hypothetical protein